MRNQRYVWATAGAALLVLGAVLGAGLNLLPPIHRAVPAGDKLMHFVLVGGLAFLANLAWRRPGPGWGPARLMAGSTVVGLVMTAEEFSQLGLAARQFSWLDLAMNWLGVVAASLGAGGVIRRGRALRRAAVHRRRMQAGGSPA